MAGIYVNDEGTWKLPKSIWIKNGTSTDGSTGWRVCKNVYVKYDGKWFEMMKTVDLTTSKQNFNLYEHVGSPTEPLSLIFTVPAEAVISSLGETGDYRTTAFTVGNFPSGSTVVINNNGIIAGGGGAGGLGGNGYRNQYNSPTKGGNAGYGLEKGSSNNYDITVVNTGTIAGGGGGGGGGTAGVQVSNVVGGGGEGGQGAGITGFSLAQGQNGARGVCVTAVPIAGGGTSCGGAGGYGGANGEDGESKGAIGGLGRPAILGSGIEIAVSGNIDGGIG